MKKHLVLLGATAALFFVSACGTSSDAPGAAPGVTSTASGAPSPEEACGPTAQSLPASLQDFACLNLVSTGGSDATGELEWLGNDPLTLVTTARDGAVSFSSKTPCNTLMSSVEVTESQFIVDPNMAMTMMACQSPQTEREAWAVKFFSAPLDYTLSTDALVLGNSHGTATFKPATP